MLAVQYFVEYPLLGMSPEHPHGDKSFFLQRSYLNHLVFVFHTKHYAKLMPNRWVNHPKKKFFERHTGKKTSQGS